MAIGVPLLSLLCVVAAVNAQNESCPFGADYPGRTREDITVYQNEPTSTNCNIDLDWIRSNSKGWTHFAALPKYPKDSREGYQGGATCGSCVKIKCSCTQKAFDYACQPGGRETVAMVVDSCPGCKEGAIDLSFGAWNDVTGGQLFSRYQGTWDFVPCPDEFADGQPKIRFHEGSDVWYYKIQPVGHKNRIEGVEVNGEPLALGGGEDFWYIGKMLQFPCRLTIRSANGGLASANLLAWDIIQDPVSMRFKTGVEFPLEGQL